MLLEKFAQTGVEDFLDFGGLKDDIIDVFVEKLLGVYIEVIMFFSFAEKLLLEMVLALTEVLTDFEMLSTQGIEGVDTFLKVILEHCSCYIY